MSVRCGGHVQVGASLFWRRLVVDLGALGPSRTEDTRRQDEGGFTNEQAAGEK